MVDHACQQQLVKLLHPLTSSIGEHLSWAPVTPQNSRGKSSSGGGWFFVCYRHQLQVFGEVFHADHHEPVTLAGGFKRPTQVHSPAIH